MAVPFSDYLFPISDAGQRLQGFEMMLTLILSGLTEADNEVKGFGIGTDDYLVKPFDRRELVARVHAIVHRDCDYAQSMINIGCLTVNLDSRRA